MKKILRLVTTSVLTLTLVACGEASSSVSTSGTQTSSSVPNVSSAYANVTSVTLSAATATLTQVLGAQRRVTVTAALNANTNPNLSLEWFVNGVKQAQISRIFDFTPTEAGSFAITARVGNLSSNTLTVTVGLPIAVVTAEKFVDSKTLELTAEGGFNVAVTGATLDDSSFYSITDGKYVLKFKSAVTQGAAVTVNLSREGFQTLSKAVVFDERVFELDEVTPPALGEIDLVNGVYQVVKPSDLTISKTYTIKLEHKNVLSTTAVNFGLETTVPAGATAVTTQSELKTGTNADDLSKQFVINSATTPGLYTFKVSAGSRNVEVKVNVIEANPEIVIHKPYIADLDGNLEVENFQMKLFKSAAAPGAGVTPTAGATVYEPVVAGADGIFEIEKPFLTETSDNNNYFLTGAGSIGQTYEFAFTFIARNFAEPGTSGVNNTFSVALVGPSAFGGELTYSTMPLEDNAANTALPTLTAFSGGYTYGLTTTSHLREIVQKFDRGTPAGVYTFTISAGQAGAEITRQVKVRLVEPQPKLDFVLAGYNNSIRTLEVDDSVVDTYVIEKPAATGVSNVLEFYKVLSNYISFEATVDEQVADSLLLAADKKLFTSATTLDAAVIRLGSLDGAAANVTTGAQTGKFYKYVDFSLGVVGPSNLIAPVLTTKLIVFPDHEKDSVVLFDNTAPTTTGDITNASYPNLDNGRDILDAVTQGAAVMNRPALTINNQTVAGTYTLTFRVDNLVRVIKIVVKDPAGKMILSSSTSSMLKIDTSENVLLVNQDSSTTLNPLVLNNQLHVGTAGSGNPAASDKLYFFTAWGNNVVPTTKGLRSNRPAVAGVADDTFYATDENILYQTTSTTTTWDDAAGAPKVVNYVGLFSEIYDLKNPLVGQRFYATDLNTVFTYRNAWTILETGSGEAADNLGNPTNGVALGATITTLVGGTVVIGTYYFNSTDGHIYKGIATASADSTAASYQKMSKPSFGLASAGLPSTSTKFLNETSTNTFEIMGTVAALTPTQSLIDFKANVELYDLPAGTYAYSVKTTYPDGRVVENADNATVAASGVDSFGKVTPVSLSQEFASHWNLQVTAAEVGTYTFEFKFGSLSKTIKVIVKENIQAKITKLSLGTTEAVLWREKYQFDSNDNATVRNRNLVANITPNAIPSEAFYQITRSAADVSEVNWHTALDADITTVDATAVVGDLVEVPAAFTTLTLGRINEAASTDDANEVSATIEWFEKVLVGVNLATGVQVFAYNQIGEGQTVTLLSVVVTTP
jgi:hypothetical protein